MITVNEMPSTYLISFAISEYDHFENLPNSVKDSDDLVEILTEKYKVELHEKLHNDNVNLNNIEKTFNKLKGKIKPNDSVLIIYNGHGKTKDDVPFWLLKNSLEEETHSWFRVSMLFDEIKGIDKAKNIAVIVNSCYSGNIFNQPYILHNPTSVKNEFKSRVVFTSGVTDQLVDEEDSSNFRNSPFVKSIISMLKENVNKYELSLSEIINYTREEFKNHNYNSNPRDGYFSNHEGGEFYFLLRNDEYAQWNEAKKEDTIEGYEGFMQKFSSDNSGYFEKARKRKLELIKEREEWLSHIEQAYNIINNFCTKPKIDNPKYLEESKALLTLLQKNKSGITQDQSAEIKWNTIRSSRNIEDFKLFEQEFPKSRYVTNSKRIRANLQNIVRT